METLTLPFKVQIVGDLDFRAMVPFSLSAIPNKGGLLIGSK